MENENIITEEGAKRPGRVIRLLSAYAVVAAIAVLVFRTVLILAIVPSGSMEDTIMSGDLVVGTRLDADDISRYDIMIFESPDEDVYYIKRVIGLPGEIIEVREGKVYADGVELDDSFLPEEMDTSGDGTYVVPEGCYFMLGDNRNNSNDSRFWDTPYVPLENFIGHARFVAYPLNHITGL